MTSLEKDIKIAQLESDVARLEKQLAIYKEQLELSNAGICPKCNELETLVRHLQYRNRELEFALINPRNAGRKRSISDETIAKIGRDYLDGMTARELSEKYKISKSTVYKIIHATETYEIQLEDKTSKEDE